MGSTGLKLPPGASLISDGQTSMPLPKGATLISPGGENSGMVTNDVGNRVITPIPGESFSDTMKRAAAYGKTVTPEMIQKEMKSAPGKVATTLAAAPAIGAAIPAAIAGGIESAPAVATAGKMIISHPVASAIALHIGRELGLPVPKVLDLLSKFTGD